MRPSEYWGVSSYHLVGNSPKMERLLGSPWDLIINMVGPGGFLGLWKTGNKLVHSRIENCPITFYQYTHTGAKNVSELKDCTVSSAKDGKVCFEYRKTMTDPKTYPFLRDIPMKLRSLHVICSEEVWNGMMPYLNALESLNIEFKFPDNKREPKLFIGFPPNLTSLMVGGGHDHHMLSNLPVGLDSLRLWGDYASDVRESSPIDVSHLELTDFWSNNDTLMTLPTTLVDLQYHRGTISGTFPFLRSAVATKITGSYPVLLRLYTTEASDLSSVNKKCEVIITNSFEPAGYCILHLRNGGLYTREYRHLSLVSGMKVERITHSGNTSMTVDGNNLDELLIMFSALKYMRLQSKSFGYRQKIRGIHYEYEEKWIEWPYPWYYDCNEW